jgi:uncharacterized protein (DUF1810 family)
VQDAREMSEAFDLRRFADAQDAGNTYARALAELRAGRKETHWMWFVFPQLAGLGESAMAQRYAISGLDEARAYLADRVLGPRLLEAVAAVTAVEGRTAHEIFGSPDDLKFRSCITLFGRVSDDPDVFRAALDRYYGGAEDPATLRLLTRA